MNKKKILALALAVTTAVSTLIPNAGIFTPIHALADSANVYTISSGITLTITDGAASDPVDATKYNDAYYLKSGETNAKFTISGAKGLVVSKSSTDLTSMKNETNSSKTFQTLELTEGVETEVYYAYYPSGDGAYDGSKWIDGIETILVARDNSPATVSVENVSGTAASTNTSNTYYRAVGEKTAVKFSIVEPLLKTATYVMTTNSEEDGAVSYDRYNGISIPDKSGKYDVVLTVTDKAGNEKIFTSQTIYKLKKAVLSITPNGTINYDGEKLDGNISHKNADIKATSNSKGNVKYSYKVKGSDAEYTAYSADGLPNEVGTYLVRAKQDPELPNSTNEWTGYYTPDIAECEVTIDKGDLSKQAGAFKLSNVTTDASSLAVTLTRDYTKTKKDIEVDSSKLSYYSIASDGTETPIEGNPDKKIGRYAVYANLTSDQVNSNYKYGIVKAGEFSVKGGSLDDYAGLSVEIVDAMTGEVVTTPQVGQTLKAKVTGFPNEGSITYAWSIENGGNAGSENESETYTVPKGQVGSSHKVKVTIGDDNNVYSTGTTEGKSVKSTTNDIAKRSLKIKSVTVEPSRVYDGKTYAKVKDITFEGGLIGTDKLADVFTMSTMNNEDNPFAYYVNASDVANGDVGTNKKIRFNNTYIGLSDSANYALASTVGDDLAALNVTASITPYVADPVDTVTNLSVADVKTGEDLDGNESGGVIPYAMLIEDVKAITYEATPVSRIPAFTGTQDDITYKVIVDDGLDYLDAVPTVTNGSNDTDKMTIRFNKDAIDKIDGVATIKLTVASSSSTNYSITGTMTINVTDKKIVDITAPTTPGEYGKENALEYTATYLSGDILPLIESTGKKLLTIYDGDEDVTAQAKAGTLDVGTYKMSIYIEDSKYFGSKESEYEVTQSTTALKASDFELSTDKAELGGEAPEAILIKKAADGVTNLSLGKAVATIKYLKKDSDYASTGVEFEEITEAGEYDAYVSVEDLEGETGNFAELDEAEDTYIGTITVGEAVEKFTVSFTDEDGNLIESQQVASGEKATKPADPTKDGYEFLGWFVSGAEEAYSFDTAVTADTTLVAKFKEVDDQKTAKYTVSFTDEEGNLITSQQVASGEKATKPVDPTKDGYEFLGWFASGAEEAYSFDSAITADTTLVAKFKKTSTDDNKQEGSNEGTGTTTGSSTDVTPSNNSGSGSSGGGGGSSNAKTVKNADGSTTTTTTTAKGTIETTTKTNADGSKTTSKVVKNKDGSGSVTETSVSAAGTTKVVEVVTDTTGAATEVTTTVSNSKGASMKVTYAAKGTAITVSKVETTGKTAVSIPATVKVGGKTYKVTKIAASALKGNKEITKVTLGKNVKSIGKNAFNGDSKLKTIVMKKAPTTVGKNAFKGIAKKATIKIKATKKAFKKAKTLIKKSGIVSTVKIKRTK